MEEVHIGTFRDALTIDFNLLERWDDFERIAEILQKYFYAEITDRLDGPESRVWSISIENAELALVNNPYGNYLKAENSNSNSVLRKIFNDWNKYSKL